jgi:hypothetical protein
LINITLSLKQYLVAIPRSLPLTQVLIYKEAARDQAQLPAGNPSMVKKVPIPVPANNTGEYKLTTMKSLINYILQNPFKAFNGATPIYCYNYAYSNIYMCCCR